MSDPTSARASDPLSIATRKNRVGFLVSSLIAILFVQAGLVPTELNAFGAKFSNWNEIELIVVNMFVLFYYFLMFIVSALSDFMAYKMRIFSADTADDQIYEELMQREATDKLTQQDKILLYRYKTHGWIFRASNPIAYLRFFVEFVLPIIIGIYAFIVMATYINKT